MKIERGNRVRRSSRVGEPSSKYGYEPNKFTEDLARILKQKAELKSRLRNYLLREIEGNKGIMQESVYHAIIEVMTEIKTDKKF